MRNQPEPACLVIADITGYTSYLAAVELDHAQDILADLMDTVVGSLRPTFRLAKLEGDAAFTYALTPTVDASALMDTVERTYFTFRRRLRDIGQASTCDCNACMRMPALDLKFLAHHGTIVRQRMAGREELVGSDVILAHRLLKNDVTERTGAAAYALYTEGCLRAAGVDPMSLGLVEHRETYDHIGEVVGWVADLGAAWVADQERTRVVVEPSAAMATLEFDLPAPPAVTWEYLTSPARRPRWQMPIPNAPKVRSMDTLAATPDGTHVTMRIERPRSAKDRAFLDAMLPQLAPLFQAGVEALRPLLQEEMARRAAEAVSSPEPEVPTSRSRFLVAPVEPMGVRSS